MAFVYRSERNMNNSLNKNSGNTFPGEYFNNSSFIKDIDRQSSEFQSNSKRELYLSRIENTPGPGSYERNILKYSGIAIGIIALFMFFFLSITSKSLAGTFL